ncbi:hypothetical protein D0962_07730 [Leptolyngbyaceae cyanobacterium CCMR0082]|uniref:Pentapeptide repeat-containing protein n=2 Tax=Adonisia TaxID=2950183 RepID=A0A6M0S3X8_9CYAN|nr:hypothetical protein [Adonisia turfae CCMR0082]
MGVTKVVGSCVGGAATAESCPCPASIPYKKPPMDTQAHGCFGCSVYTIIKFPWNVSLVDANLGGVTLDNANLQEANLSSADPACV